MDDVKPSNDEDDENQIPTIEDRGVLDFGSRSGRIVHRPVISEPAGFGRIRSGSTVGWAPVWKNWIRTDFDDSARSGSLKYDDYLGL